MAAQIVFNATPGSIIVSALTVVTCSNFSDAGVLGWQWTLKDKPLGSTATLSNPNAAAPTFTADIPGVYVVELKTYTDAARTIADGVDLEAVGVRYPLPFDWLIPGAFQTTQFDAAVGWKAELNDNILEDIRTRLLDMLAYNGFTTTSGAGAKTILTIPTATDISYIMEVGCIGTRSDGADVFHFIKRFSVKNDGGVVSAVGVEDIVYEKRSGMAAADMTKSISGTNIVIQILSGAVIDVRWKAYARVFLQSGVN